MCNKPNHYELSMKIWRSEKYGEPAVIFWAVVFCGFILGFCAGYIVYENLPSPHP